MRTKITIRLIIDTLLLLWFLYKFTQTPDTDIKQLLVYTSLIAAELVIINNELRRN